MPLTVSHGGVYLPSELLPLIARHVPLYARPSTLLALGLSSRGAYQAIHDLLYSCLVLRNESDAISIFQRILADPDLGGNVKELHVMSELTVATINKETPFDTVTGLKRVVKAGYLPQLRTLVVRLLKGGRHDEPWYRVAGFGHLEADFWEDLTTKSPRIQTIVLSGIGDRTGDTWLQESGIYEVKTMKKLVNLGLTFSMGGHSQHNGTDILLTSIRDLSSSLHTLVLGLNNRFESASPILSLNFRQLRSLTLGMFSVPDVSEAMAFWERHPLIEKLKLIDTYRTSHWFAEDSPADLLPNLQFFAASFHDVRSAISILPRLVGLSIQQSINAQVPYLLRSLMPDGLPALESLEIDQDWSADGDTLRRYEGSMWYESQDGKFHVEKKFKNAAKTFTQDYIHSIAKGAPNLKELCLHGVPVHPTIVIKLAEELSGFRKLERFYYRGVHDSNLALRTVENRDALYTSSRVLAERCHCLQSVTDISHLPYLGARIRRNHEGLVECVVPYEGCGMLIGSEDEAFPMNPDPLVNAG
ncbi:hypothetical protein CVT26_006104 [Gymnopilus dilepis]|uniref:Uncharacterized protein n=1 Tax=Gymnopilus dilepis TaxID=231916 RepID=A0A409YKK4_9AGAR|nr:hypothetical protein CVT26_006104 [Gymnopilus dilepis]